MELNEDSLERNISPEEVHQLMVEKAEELFSLCDKEVKGFITKRDMQRLRQDFSLTPEQLEDVFDNLDDDKNGYLTLKEFTEGFGAFLGINIKSSSPITGSLTDEQKNSDIRTNQEKDEDELDDELFQSLLDHIGGHDIFGENADVKRMWTGMRKENQKLLTSFEEFLGRVNREMIQSKAEYANLEEAYKTKANMHDNHIKQLYEEMEVQIGNEKERLLAEESAKELKIREDLEAELREKDTILQDVLLKHKKMEETLCELNVTEAETKHENTKLQKEKIKLEQKLDDSKKIIEDMRDHTDNLRKNANEEKRLRARAALQATEGIALERETLVRQLDVLKSLNQKLMDEKDESLLTKSSNKGRGERLSDVLDEGSHTFPVPKPRRILEKRGSTLGDYFEDPSRMRHDSVKRLDSIVDEPEAANFDCDSDDAFYDNEEVKKPKDVNIENNLNVNVCESPKVLNNAKLAYNGISDTDDDNNNNKYNNFKQQQIFIKNSDINQDNKKEQGTSSTGNLTVTKNINVDAGPLSAITTQPSPKDDWKVEKKYFTQKSVDNEDSNISITEPKINAKNVKGWKVKKNSYFDNPLHGETNEFSDLYPHMQDTWKVQLMLFPAAMISMQLSEEEDIQSEIDEGNLSSQRQPERVYKVVFIGDSSVGKTSFINRFCKDSFSAHFSATIGVDFQIKSINADGRTIALQLWDTAGQERYRSITKQYFRRADGVVVIYDITSEISFKNVRLWVQNIQDAAIDEHIVLLLIGNKIDLCPDDESREITLKDAERLADEYHALHYEVSAKTGASVQTSMEALAGLLQEKEDEEIQKVLKLNDSNKKNKCCKT